MKATLHLLSFVIACAGCQREESVSDAGSVDDAPVTIEAPPELESAFPHTPSLPQLPFIVQLAKPSVDARASAFMSGFVEGYEHPNLPERDHGTPEGSGFNTGQNARDAGFDLADIDRYTAGIADGFTQDFTDYFFRGFISPSAKWSGIDDFEHAAIAAGARFRLEHPERMRDTFLDFGFEEVDLSGEWSLGHSHSGFRTPDLPKHEYWWLHTMTGSAPEFATDIPDGRYDVRVRGFLRLPGAYGHLGSYPRELYATELRKTDGEQDAAMNNQGEIE